jgi:hypothetical protein
MSRPDCAVEEDWKREIEEGERGRDYGAREERDVESWRVFGGATCWVDLLEKMSNIHITLSKSGAHGTNIQEPSRT